MFSNIEIYYSTIIIMFSYNISADELINQSEHRIWCKRLLHFIKTPDVVPSFSLIIALHQAHFADAACDTNLLYNLHNQIFSPLVCLFH